MKVNRPLLIIAEAFLLTNTSAGLPFQVWSEVNGRSDTTAKKKVRIKHDLLLSALEDPYNQDSLSLSFPLQGKDLVCDMRTSALLAPGLANKHKELKVLSGGCADGSSASMVFNLDRRGSLSATLLTGGRPYYVDHKDEDDDLDIYSLSTWRGMDKVNNHVIGDGSNRHRFLRGLGEQPQGFIFRIAILTTKELSSEFGTTRSDVLTKIAVLMARVNGVFLRELGVMFQLIEKSDQLICLFGESDCEHWVNYNGSAFLEEVDDYFYARGVLQNEFDIGHGLTNQSGGVTFLESLCTDIKARGVSGGYDPSGDLFETVSHEIGHQLGGRHSFRDCEGEHVATNNQHQPLGAVEPGSGTSIMSYAGGCGGTMIQARTDPWFNSNNLVQMRGFIVIASAELPSCGESFAMENTAKPIMESVSTCTIPKGNYVQLGGRVVNWEDMNSDVFYAWDRVDAGVQEGSYLDRNVPRFVPHEPTTRSPLRFLPSMYLLSFGLVDSQLEEIHPNESVPGDVAMVFRFIGRTQYGPSAPIDNFDVDLAGTFGYYDVALTYVSSESPLKFTTPISGDLVSSTNYTLTWSGGTDLTRKVEILFAINTMTEEVDYDYDKHAKDLDWYSMGLFDSIQGSGTVTIPELHNPDLRPVNLMIRSVVSNYCHFFDLMHGLVYNRRPMALCQDLTVTANENCGACVTAAQVDNNSNDPEDGLPAGMELDTYCFSGVGSHDVILTVTDSGGASDQCSAVVTIIDDTPPEAICLPISKPGGKSGKSSKSSKSGKCGKSSKSSKSNSGYYAVGGSDNCESMTQPTMVVFDSDIPQYEFVGPFDLNGTNIKYTSTQCAEKEQKPGQGDVVWKLKGKGALHVQVTDGVGLISTVACHSSPAPKG